MQQSLAEPEQPTSMQQMKALPAMLSMRNGLTVSPQDEASHDSTSADDVIGMVIDDGAMAIPAGGETEVSLSVSEHKQRFHFTGFCSCPSIIWHQVCLDLHPAGLRQIDLGSTMAAVVQKHFWCFIVGVLCAGPLIQDCKVAQEAVSCQIRSTSGVGFAWSLLAPIAGHYYRGLCVKNKG